VRGDWFARSVEDLKDRLADPRADRECAAGVAWSDAVSVALERDQRRA
jgi:hypothetical protein